jgi:hypothetical protein
VLSAQPPAGWLPFEIKNIRWIVRQQLLVFEASQQTRTCAPFPRHRLRRLPSDLPPPRALR